MNHLYVFPRYTVIPGHEHKAFIPYNRIFHKMDQAGSLIAPKSNRHLVVHATVKDIQAHSLTLSRAVPEVGIAEPKLAFDYLVYALGSHPPEPIDLWGPINLGAAPYNGTKPGGMDWIQRAQKRIEDAPSILVVGGGALGIQYATDIADAYPDKPVALLHSREQLLPKFDQRMHDKILARMKELGVNLVLGERLDLSSVPPSALTTTKEHVLRTLSGREIPAGLVLLCTGQRPNTELLRGVAPESIIADGPKKGQVLVSRAMQLAERSTKECCPDGVHALHPHMFVIGDAADAFGASKLGYFAYSQGFVAANNILKLIQRQEGHPTDETLESYEPLPPGIKLSVGLTKAVYQLNGEIGEMTEQPVDWDAAFMWRIYGHPDVSRD
ncbi:FAD/NAD(P)-binding domain-containing protein [Phanerochaete sordida]|uniref:FAD/NAD(P)-binding domain-containing protein n=1 Tax=Phanerochaete sordida TaxID=48140 RepID=A0A9P3GW02_9APHY|nr:FAD/NAD(P)-binding domain-containing protein [Phanerochaete sordida]